MRVEFKQDGGFAALPGLSKPFTLDSDSLSAAQCRDMQTMIEACHFFELPKRDAAPRTGAADYRQFTLTVVDGKRHNTIMRSEPIGDADVQALIEFIQALQRGQTPDDGPQVNLSSEMKGTHDAK